MIQSYRDACIELEILEFRKHCIFEDLRRQANELDMCPNDIVAINYDGMPKGSSKDIALDERWYRIIETRDKLWYACEKVEAKKKEIEKIKEQFSRLEGVYHKVFYWHKMESKSLKEVASILGYDYCYIRELWFKLKRIENIT